VRVYEAIVKGLESAGVEAAFGGAGENAAGMMIALDESERIRPIITRHEQAASFMACGYAMFTNKLGFCFATAGPGAFNLFSGLAMALSDSYPVFAVSGYANRHWTGRGSLNETSGEGMTPNSRAMFAATTKKSVLLEHPEDVSDVVEDLVNVALSGKPGPVHLHVPEDLTEHGIDVADHYHDVRLRVPAVLPDPGEVERVADVLAAAIRDDEPIVALVGFGAVRSSAGAEVRRFIERFQIPLLTTQDGKGIVTESHPLSLGVFADSGHASAWKAFREAKVVLAIGNSLNQHATFNYREDLFDGKVLIQVNISSAEFGRSEYKPAYTLLSDARPGVAALTEALDRKVGDVRPARVEGRDWEARRILLPSRKIHPGKLAQAIGRMLPPGAILLADAGAHLAWLSYYVELEDGQAFRKAGSFGPMAGHTNGALGVKVAHPDRPVIVGCGDGCYSLAGFELMTAVQYGIPVIWIVFDDSEFKLIKLFQLSEYGKSALVDFDNPDFAAYARACGADGYTVDELDDFEKAFADALASGRPSVIDARITRWAVPHYSPSPDGVIAGLVERVEERLRDR
jgi:acetolactate synthase I/II/III large subunit